MKRSGLFILFGFLLLLSVFTATTAQDAVELRYTLWIGADTPQVALFNEIAAEYNALHPNVTVSFESIPFGDYESDVTLQLAGSNPPDAGWIVERTAPSWGRSGILADLGPALKGDESYNFADYSEGSMALWTSGDAVYGVPFSTSPFLMMYNIDLFEAVGIDTPDVMIENGEWTWDNVRAAAKAIADATDAFGFQSTDAALYTNAWPNTLIPIMRAYGGDVWDADNTCTFNGPETVASPQLVHDMIFADGGMVPPGTEVDFYAGGAAMNIGQLSRVNRLADAAFKWDIAPLPSGPAGYQPVIGQAAMVVFNNSPNRDVAIDFIKYMTTEENVARLAQFFPPARATVLASDALAQANPLVPAERMQSVVIDTIKEGTVLTAHPQFTRLDLMIRPLLDTLWVADADVQAVTDSICESITPLLAR